MSPRWLRLAFVALAVLAAMQACESQSSAPASERAFSVQLHLHGSFSEGQGSLDSHGYEASDVGCDVLWWSDHDFRVTTFEHVSRFGFEGWEEALDRAEPWKTRLAKYRGDKKRVQIVARPDDATSRFTDAPVKEGARSLRVTARSSTAEFEPHLLALSAERKLQRRSLATRVTLRLAVFPEELGPDARVVVEAELSEHAPREGLGLVPCVVRYEVSSAPTTEAPRRDGATYVVPVRCELGRWNELELPLSADAVRGFPLFPGEDNALYRLAFGVETRKGAGASACFDDLRIDQELAGPAVFAREGELIREVGKLYPELRQLQGIEVSYDSRHLNVFCAETPLLDYAALVDAAPRDAEEPELVEQKAFRSAVIERAVSEAHRRGGLVSYNHPFGATFEEGERPRDNEQQLAILLRNRAEGADLLEVGYRERGGATLDDHLWLWDQAALAGLRLVGTGVSDSHGGPDNRWRGQPNNFVSWIYASEPNAVQLIEGLRAGRVFFGDLERFDGTLDLVTDAGHRMGRTVLTDRDQLEVELVALGAHAGERVVVVESGRRGASYEVEGADFRRRHALQLPENGPAFVRFELHGPDGAAFALSNPIHFLRELPAEGLPAAVAALDVFGLQSRVLERVDLLACSRAGADEKETVTFGLRGASGRLLLDLGGRHLSGASFVRLAGSWSVAEGCVDLRDLDGEGEIALELER